VPGVITRRRFRVRAGGAIVLTALISVLLAKNAPDYARDIVYGVVILVILLFYGRQSEETA
jgi:ribose transport system permease protein